MTSLIPSGTPHTDRISTEEPIRVRAKRSVLCGPRWRIAICVSEHHVQSRKAMRIVVTIASIPYGRLRKYKPGIAP